MTDRRAFGYRLLGRGFDYVLHLRPAEWPILAIHLVTGTALSVGMTGVFAPAMRWVILSGALSFVVGLNGGTLALNSAFDRDEGDVAYLRRPPPPPRGLAVFALGLMLAGLVVAARLPSLFLAVYALCLILSVLYSVPPIRLKAVAGADWVINMAGFGLLTPLAGWALTGKDVVGPGRTVLAAFAILFGALYPLTQLYQLEEDTRRGDRTLACVLGLDRSLLLAMGTALVAFAGFTAAGVASGWGLRASGFPRWLALVAAASAWAVVLVPWWRHRSAMDPSAHQAGMHRALAAWAVTDMAVLFAWAR